MIYTFHYSMIAKKKQFIKPLENRFVLIDDWLKIQNQVCFIYLYLILPLFLLKDKFKSTFWFKKKILEHNIWMTWGKSRCSQCQQFVQQYVHFIIFNIHIKYYHIFHMYSFCKSKQCKQWINKIRINE